MRHATLFFIALIFKERFDNSIWLTSLTAFSIQLNAKLQPKFVSSIKARPLVLSFVLEDLANSRRNEELEFVYHTKLEFIANRFPVIWLYSFCASVFISVLLMFAAKLFFMDLSLSFF